MTQFLSSRPENYFGVITSVMFSSPRIAVLHVGSFLSKRGGYNLSFLEELANEMEFAGWRIYRTSDAESRLIRLARIAATCWLRRNDYEVAHIAVYSGRAFILAEVASWLIRISGRPLVLSLHGGSLPVFARRWPRRVKRLLSSAVAVTAPSGYLLEQMRPYRGDLLLLPNPLEVSNYNYTVRQEAKPRLIWLRAFHEIYNPSLAPKVVALLAQEFPQVELTMVGPDKGDGSLQAMKEVAGKLEVNNQITLLGGVPKEEVSIHLSNGDIFLNTANVDNTPISVLEAMACGLCVVSSNVGGMPYLVEDELDGLLVPPGDAPAMATAVRRILTEPGLARKLSANARKKAERFDWSAILPQWESLLMSVAGGSSPHDPRLRHRSYDSIKEDYGHP